MEWFTSVEPGNYWHHRHPRHNSHHRHKCHHCHDCKNFTFVTSLTIVKTVTIITTTTIITIVTIITIAPIITIITIISTGPTVTRGALETYIKYIEQNYTSMQTTEKYLLATVALHDCYEAMIVRRYLLVFCRLNKSLK